MIAGVETGGTKTVCALAVSATAPFADVDIVPTTDPAGTGAAIRGVLRAWEERHGPLEGLGVAAFGPLDLDPRSPGYRTITATPKRGWEGVRIDALVGERRPFSLVSDVTGAAIGEAATQPDPIGELAYITVGTGVGVGVVLRGAPHGRRGHPELGHLPVRRHPRDGFDGVCPFHGDCLEGLASGPALAARWGRPAEHLDDDRERAVEMAGSYLGQLLAAVTYAYVPQRIVLGGGVMKLPGLHDAARRSLAAEIGGALGEEHPARRPGSGLVVAPLLGDHSGVRGALMVAAQSAQHR